MWRRHVQPHGSNGKAADYNRVWLGLHTDIYEDCWANTDNHSPISNGIMTEAAAVQLPQGQTEMPPALQRLWKRRSNVTAPQLEDINLGVLEDPLSESAQVGEQRVA